MRLGADGCGEQGAQALFGRLREEGQGIVI